MALTEELQALAARVSNWGRWGVDDRRGTLNLIDDAAVRRGVAAARQGRSFSLAMPFDEHGPQMGFIPGRVNPQRTMVAINDRMGGGPDDVGWNDDAVTMGLQAVTHWDAIGHAAYSGYLYNGVPESAADEAGLHELGIETFGPITTRGVLLDIARLQGVDNVPGGYPITGADLDAAAAMAGVHVEPGDIVCLRTGHQALFRAGDRMGYAATCPGPSAASVEWFRDHDVAAVAADTLIFEVFPGEAPNPYALPVHMIHLRDMGLVQGQNWVLDPLAADCAADDQYDFLLVATPLPFTRGAGGPVAPTAIK